MTSCPHDTRSGPVRDPSLTPPALLSAGIVAGLLCGLPAVALAGPSGAAGIPGSGAQAPAAACPAAAADRTVPDPFEARLEPTGRGRDVTGRMVLRYASSPFEVAVGPDGHSDYRVRVRVSGGSPRSGTYVVWAATPDLDEHVKLGPVADGEASGRIWWNKFIVFVTVEESSDVDRWQGPIVLRGFSPSARMHTMRGHGLYEAHGIGC